MRLRRLDLIRYGKFETRSLDFGERGAESDVAIVYGDNEAGKSTAFAAWLDLLFGFPRQHPYAYRFQRSEMMVGAVLEAGDEVLELRRTGAQNGSLTDANGREVEELRLKSLLHGLDRDAYRTRFSLDVTELNRGGEEISRAQGDLGRLLHAGMSGLSGLSDTLDAIEKEVDAFHRKGGRTTALRTAMRELEDLKARLAGSRLEPRRFDALRHALEAAENDLKETGGAFAEAQARLALREAADKRRGIRVRMDELGRALAAHPQGPPLSADAIRTVTEAVARRHDAAEGLAEARRRAEEARVATEGIAADPAGLEVAVILDVLEEARFDDGEYLLPRVQTAAADIETRRASRAALQRDAVKLAEAIGGPGASPEDVRLTRGALATLRKRAEDLCDAEARLKDTARLRDKAEAELGPQIPMPEGRDALGDALEALDRLRDDPEAAARQAEELRLASDRAAAGLPADWRAIAEAGLPPEAEAMAVAAAATEADRALREAQARLAEAEEICADARARQAALLDRGDVATDDEIERTRGARDAAWTRHRASLDDASAGAFEAEMLRDDEARDRHARSAEKRIELASVAHDLARHDAASRRRRAEWDDACAALEATRRDAAVMAARLGLAGDTPPASFRERRMALAGALDARLLTEASQAAAEAASKRRRGALVRLSAALVAAEGGEIDLGDARLDPAARRCKTALDRQADASRARTHAAGTLESLNRDLREKAEAAEACRTAYTAAVAGLWCADRPAQALLAAMDDLQELAELHGQAQDLDRRIDLMNAALERFAEMAGDLAGLLGLDPEARVAELIARARGRAGAARKTAQRIAEVARALADAETAIGAHEAAISRSDAAIAGAFAGQEGIDLSQPSETLATLQARDALRRDLAQLSADHDQAGAGHDAEALRLEEDDADPLRSDELRSVLHETGEARDAALQARGEAKASLHQAMQAAGGADLDQQRATILEGVREEARLKAAQAFGHMAARGALRRFRHDSRGDMLMATEAAFVHLTRGEWSGLDVQPGGRTERLVGIRNGEPVPAEAMSTGTRGQLYLALRVAGYAAFSTRFGPLPFVTDDVHETFDDDRARAALGLSAEMGREGQAIVFTHHRHLVELARHIIPGASCLGF
ncbi:AAA family ATPase [Albimonas pacifica]|uniref:Uncharacterized protein YhaN n=1 Tax=Albimonas pacifica TaxID=1114924 RepID=A0A1I3PSZ4_9RHOB|nr:AAA family ATPase [Albimonas pacifica]SFJ24904.1 Uncharacterized protein YhaN [Albimonas pacifica]